LQYAHGGAPQRDMIRLGVPCGPVLDFSVNLNPLGPPSVIKESWEDLFEAVEPYPGVEGDGVARYYETVCGKAPRHFLAGNGSTEMIYLAPRVLGFKRAAVITPSYHDYERASLLAGAEVRRWQLAFGDGFAFPPKDRLADLLKEADAIWIGRPNNPTGNLVSKELILELAHRFPQIWFLVDEAFVQFLPDWKTQSLLTEDPVPNILVIHSLTKFFAIAGLRLGGIAGSETAISRLRRAKEPWTVNGIADRAASLLADCTDYAQEARVFVDRERDRLFQGLQGMEGIVPYPAAANYILCRWVKTRNLDDLLRHLLSNGAYVRDCRNFPGLAENFFRIGLKGRGDNDRLLSLLSSFQIPPHRS
jgi:threonine-phosphate decarboxylase